jgi:CheY-like chemotaxis protein
MDREIVLAILAIAPQLIVLGIVAIAGARYREQISRALGSRVTSVSVLGFKMDLSAAAVDDAVASRTKPDGGSSGSPVADRLASSKAASSSAQVVQRAHRMAPHLQGRTILWVDDQPTGNRIERRLLRQMGVFVETVTSNDQAMTVLNDPAESISLVISDIQRASGPSGLDLVQSLAVRPGHPSIVLYIGKRDDQRPLPPGAFGLADRPDELLNLVMDALDRMPEIT